MKSVRKETQPQNMGDRGLDPGRHEKDPQATARLRDLLGRFAPTRAHPVGRSPTSGVRGSPPGQTSRPAGKPCKACDSLLREPTRSDEVRHRGSGGRPRADIAASREAVQSTANTVNRLVDLGGLEPPASSLSVSPRTKRRGLTVASVHPVPPVRDRPRPMIDARPGDPHGSRSRSRARMRGATLRRARAGGGPTRPPSTARQRRAQAAARRGRRVLAAHVACGAARQRCGSSGTTRQGVVPKMRVVRIGNPHDGWACRLAAGYGRGPVTEDGRPTWCVADGHERSVRFGRGPRLYAASQVVTPPAIRQPVRSPQPVKDDDRADNDEPNHHHGQE